MFYICSFMPIKDNPMTHPGPISHRHFKPHQTHADVDDSSVLIRKPLQLYGGLVISKLNSGGVFAHP